MTGIALADPGQVARYLAVPEKTLSQWRYLGTGPRFLKVGRFVRYRWEDVEEWLQRQTRDATQAL